MIDRPYTRTELGGSSSTTEGKIGGSAVGNDPNMADIEEASYGKVKIYHDMVNPYDTGASRACDIRVTPSLARLLKRVNGRWSNISSASKLKIAFPRYGFTSF